MKNRKLLFSVTIHDCDVQTFTVGGPGGGGKDTSNTGVRITHPPSGAVGEGREERSQLANKRAAWTRMGRSDKFKAWARIEAARRCGGPSIDELVEEAMRPEHIKAEVNVAGKWTPLTV